MRYLFQVLTMTIIAAVLVESAAAKSYRFTDEIVEDFAEVIELRENEGIPRKKRSYDVRINKRLDEDELLKVGAAIRSIDPRVERTFVSYYLPGMKIGSGAWATTHFTPVPNVQIMEFMLTGNPTTLK